MKSWQHKILYQKFHNRDQTTPYRVFISTGKFKNNFAAIRYLNGPHIEVQIEDMEDSVSLHYTAIEELDEQGEILIKPVIDMTGREIQPDSYVCYSVNDGNSHALEIGKVTEITRTGGLKVKPLVKNGQAIGESNMWRYRKDTVLNDPFRSIKLPVDLTGLMMWIMQDFEEMGKQQ